MLRPLRQRRRHLPGLSPFRLWQNVPYGNPLFIFFLLKKGISNVYIFSLRRNKTALDIGFTQILSMYATHAYQQVQLMTGPDEDSLSLWAFNLNNDCRAAKILSSTHTRMVVYRALSAWNRHGNEFKQLFCCVCEFGLLY